jgi:hypothetical protein
LPKRPVRRRAIDGGFAEGIVAVVLKDRTDARGRIVGQMKWKWEMWEMGSVLTFDTKQVALLAKKVGDMCP